MDYPALTKEHINGAKLFADRFDMISSLDLPRAPAIAEVGVAQGDFSEFLLSTLKPSRFVAMDIFTMHQYPVHWGVPQEVMFKGMTHEEFYRDRFRDFKGLEVISGESRKSLATLEDHSLDLIYVDAQHEYEGVSQDAKLSAMKLKPSGALVFNDYIMFDHHIGAKYGVVQAVNELIDQGGWEVTGFALQRDMFCDIAIRRRRNEGRLSKAIRAFLSEITTR